MVNFIKKLIPEPIINLYHRTMPFFGALIYRFPSRKIKAIAVTGTNGKTTTVNMISEILEQAGYKTASFSSIKFRIGKEEQPNLLKMTMPGRMTIQKLLRKAVDKGCQYAVFEVSSEGIKQFRHLCINFDIALITNLSLEHIEAHGSFENYREMKGRLFKAVKKIHIVNLDDEHKDFFLGFPAEEKWGFGTKSDTSFKGRVVKAKDCSSDTNGVSFKTEGIDFKIPLFGSFNIYNALAAISAGLACGVDLETSKQALGKIKTIPGRTEEVVSDPFKVIIDYAVTPDALENLYKAIADTLSVGKIIAVLGACGGGRDKWKRPVLGKIAQKYCDKVIVTNEDPYNEDPMEIINSIAESAGAKSIKILDRRSAIKKALSLARKGDAVVITGKGCEPWMCLAGGKKIAWDDRQVAREEFRKLYVQ